MTIYYEITVKDEILGGADKSPILFVTLTKDGTAKFWATEMRNDEPADGWSTRDTFVWTSRLRQGALAMADREKINRLAHEISQLLNRVCEGINSVGRLSGDAQDASTAIAEIVSEYDWTSSDQPIYDASQWIAENMSNVHGDLSLTPRADDTDKAIAAVALEDFALSKGVRLHNTSGAIDTVVDQLRQQGR